MAVVIRLQRAHVNAMLAHAFEEWPLECCGIVATTALPDGGLPAPGEQRQVTQIVRAKNEEASPYRFSIHPLKGYKRISDLLDEQGQAIAGTYHSHTGSEAIASPTDIRMMETFFAPPFFHFVVGVRDWRQPELRVFHIADGAATEQAFEVADG